MNRILVDTSAWYAYIRRDDPDHDRVRAALDAGAGGLFLTNFIFDEVVTLVRARLGHSAAVKIGRTIRSSSDVELVRVLPGDEDTAWEMFQRNRDKAYSFTDCTSFAVMRRLGMSSVVATDRHFQQAGFRVEP